MNIEKIIALIARRRVLVHISFWAIYIVLRWLFLKTTIGNISAMYAFYYTIYLLLFTIFFYYYIAYLIPALFRHGQRLMAILLIPGSFPVYVILSTLYVKVLPYWDHSFYVQLQEMSYWKTFFDLQKAAYTFAGVIWGVLPPLMIRFLLEIYRHVQQQQSIISYNKQLARTQAHSHLPADFIFGTLQLMRQKMHDNKNADQAIDKLSNLLDFAFYKSQHKTVTIQEEIDFLESYIGFERMRHSPNRVSIQFEHSISKNSTIPPLLFINFIENAFKHGVNSTIQQSWVKIFLHENNGILLFKAQNSLPKNTPKDTGGIGLKNVRRRLELEFPDKFVLNSMKSDIFEIDLVIQLR